ncbi:MAG: MBL fold metallo-hydrolase [Cytophagales bacterium]|nr:MBL fold metallo-hydrolase [Cytophagales bacterium]
MQVIDLCFQQIPGSIACFFFPDLGVLVETGPHSTLPHLKRGLIKIGHSLEDVKHVLLSHIHLDHAGAAWCWRDRDTQIYVHPAGYPHLKNPEKLWHSAQRIYGDKMQDLWGDMKAIPAEKLVAVEDQEQIIHSSFTAHHTPGHAQHHIAWQWEDIIFTGDVAGVCIDQGPVIAPCPPPDLSPEAWLASIDKIARLKPKELMLTHYGPIQEPEKHLKDLKESLHTLEAWMRKAFKKSDNPQDIISAFEEYTQNLIQKRNLSSKGLEKYLAANPPWMSVYGWLRYLKKET